MSIRALHSPGPTALQKGFTLIEMSIVLVIIALIIGGILTGQDLINTAKERNLITQIGQYQIATRTFQNKYGHLPGDITPSIASQFGMFALTGTIAGTQYHGDDNGQVDANASTPDCGEVELFWRHLTDAQLVNGTYGKGTVSNGALDPTTDWFLGNMLQPTFPGIFPTTAFDNVFVTAKWMNSSPWSGRNAFQVSSYTHGIFSYCTLISAPTPLITPNQVYHIDSKIDDGKPATGSVLYSGSSGTTGGVSPSWTANSTSGYCTYGGASVIDPTSQYNIGAYGNILSCLTLTFVFQ